SSENFMSLVKRKKMDYEEFHRLQNSLSPQLEYNGFKRLDLVVESVVEDLDVKKRIFSEVEKKISPHCIVASNTSSLSISEMASSLEDSSRFAGLHFFNPVHKMPLVEIITHDNISAETVKALHSWCVKMKKTPIIVKDGPGFLVNRILIPYINESAFLLEEGLSPEDLEEACVNFGMPIGPGRLLDEVGMDVASKVGKILHKSLGERVHPASLSGKLEEAGFLGKKNGKGFYLYDDKGNEAGPNEEFLRLLPKETIKMDEIQIQMRIFLPMINEAANILEEGLVDHASTIDLALIFGIGFPPFRGGLLRYADKEGLERILEALEGFAKTVDEKRYGPSNYLKKLVEGKKKFYE
ncbi:MAG: 3-hydroxyacyl-CoA dehydrogenase NAD-binding domain-containing protein, partial [Bdellovibrionota bacterium]|nr:3-hydroxyacyl-CoA dehydrogenase NAD-binding domain-containing protein [Bdellovibrionota bacterium]